MGDARRVRGIRLSIGVVGKNRRCSPRAILEEETVLAPVAQFEWHLQTDSWEWESTVFDVYGVRAEDVVPSDAAFLSLKHPDDAKPRQAMMQMLKSGKARHTGTGSFVKMASCASSIPQRS
jgi:hypothetical protein